jgi:hypothetical protein
MQSLLRIPEVQKQCAQQEVHALKTQSCSLFHATELLKLGEHLEIMPTV